MAGIKPGHVCAGIVHLRRLDTAGMVAVLASLPPSSRSQCVRYAGLRLRHDAPVDRVAKLLVSRLRTIDGAEAHNVVVAITDPARAQLLGIVGEDEERFVNEVARGLTGPLAQWSAPVLGALFALLGELGAFPAATQERLLGLLVDGRDDSGESGQGKESTSKQSPESGAAFSTGPRFASVIEPPPPSHEPSTPTSVAPLDAVLREALLVGHARADAHSLDRAVVAVDELLSLDGLRTGSWRLRGLADGLSGNEPRRPEPPTPDAAFQHLLGVVEALVHAGRFDGLADLVSRHPTEIERLVADPAESVCIEPVLRAALGGGPAVVRRLLVLVPGPFPAWPNLVEWLRVTCDRLSVDDPVIAAGLLRAGDEMLTAWTPRLATRELDAVEQVAAELAVERARCHRRAGDFVGTRAVLGRIDPAQLSAPARARSLEEGALAACEVASLEGLRFSSGLADCESTRVRFARAAPEIEAAVSAGSDLVGRVLRAVISVAQDQPTRAVADLRVARAVLAEKPDRSPGECELLTRLEFQLGLNELCMLEPGTDDGAIRRIEAAVAAGHRPTIGELSTIAVALDAHGSPHTLTAVGRVLDVAPADDEANRLLIGLVARHAAGAARLAAGRGCNDQLPRRLRFELLEVALSGAIAATAEGDGPNIEMVADDLERLVAKAADADLDRRWVARLASDDALRTVLGPDTVDLVRLHALRRAGLTDDAAAVARGLYHRAVGGHVEGVDAADLLELLGQLGAGVDEVQALRRLLPSDVGANADADIASIDGVPDRPILVLFVGGNETQARAWPGIQGAVTADYGGVVTVKWFETGWGSNWGDAAKEIESLFSQADVLVVMTFVRTMLGRRLRRTAGESGIPWVACTGHGRASIERAIARAVALAR